MFLLPSFKFLYIIFNSADIFLHTSEALYLMNSVVLFLFRKHSLHSHMLRSYSSFLFILCLLPEWKAHEGRAVRLFCNDPVWRMLLEFDVFHQFGKLSASISSTIGSLPFFPSRTPITHTLNLSLYFVCVIGSFLYFPFSELLFENFPLIYSSSRNLFCLTCYHLLCLVSCIVFLSYWIAEFLFNFNF